MLGLETLTTPAIGAPDLDPGQDARLDADLTAPVGEGWVMADGQVSALATGWQVRTHFGAGRPHGDGAMHGQRSFRFRG